MPSSLGRREDCRFRPQSRQSRRRQKNRADHIISIKGKPSADISKELRKAADQSDLDAIIDCAGAAEMMQLGFSLLSISGHYVDVGLVGDRIDIPRFPRVRREQTFHGSFCGNYTDLSQVMALAAQGKIRRTLTMFTFGQINELYRPGENGRSCRQGCDEVLITQ
jgi:propanol-preferring alcohol dehydrogenase